MNVLFRLIGFTFFSVLIASLVMLAVALYSINRGLYPAATVKLPAWTVLVAAIAALVPTLAVIPHPTPDGFILAAPIFDQAKIAIIDEISRGNFPPLNPFFFESGLSDRLAYYWGWYASAAHFSVLFGTSGWEAAIALAWFTAASSLLLMMSIAIWLCGKQSAALFVVLLSSPRI